MVGITLSEEIEINMSVINETLTNITQPELQLLTQKITQLEARITVLEQQIQKINGSVIIQLG